LPKRHEHHKRAQDNESLSAALNHTIPHCVDWAVTMLFYAGLHYIDAFLAGKNAHPLNHEARDEEIESNGSLSPIYRDYRRLKDLSRAARYEIANFGPDQLNTARQRLAKIKQHLGV